MFLKSYKLFRNGMSKFNFSLLIYIFLLIVTVALQEGIVFKGYLLQILIWVVVQQSSLKKVGEEGTTFSYHFSPWNNYINYRILHSQWAQLLPAWWRSPPVTCCSWHLLVVGERNSVYPACWVLFLYFRRVKEVRTGWKGSASAYRGRIDCSFMTFLK